MNGRPWDDFFLVGNATYIHTCTFIIIISFQVMRLYRHSLRCLLDWCIDRDIFHDESTKLRERFDANRVTSMANAQRLIDVS